MATGRVMIDIETLGKRRNAAIIEIAAVQFEETGILCEFDFQIEWESNDQRTVDFSTLKWWQEIGFPKEAEKPTNLSVALWDLSKWIDEMRNIYSHFEIWANSPSFDLEILRDAFEQHGYRTPWKYWEERDYRTLRNWYDMPRVEYAAKHTALSDAKFQAEMVAKLLKQHSNIL